MWLADDQSCFVRTGRDGTFDFLAPWREWPALHAGFGGYRVGAAEVSLGMAQERILFQLDRADGVIEGQVVGAAGVPVAGARVALEDEHHLMTPAVETDEQGIFRFEGLPPHITQGLEISKRGFLPTRARLEAMTNGEAARPRITLAQLVERAIRSVVLGPSGTPIAGAEVHLLVGQMASPLGESAEDGSFRFVGRAPASYTLRIVMPGFGTEEESFDLPAGTGDFELEPIRLLPEAVLEGTVLSADQQPLGGCRIYIGRGARRGAAEGLEGPRSERAAVSGEDGRFELRRLRRHQGSELQIWCDGWLPHVRRVLPAEDSQTLVVTLEPAVELRGEIREEGGDVVPGATVRLFHRELTWLPLGTFGVLTTDREGRFRIPFLRPGPLRVEISGPAHGRSTETVEIPPGRPFSEARLTLRRPAILEGSVRDSSGRPLPRAAITYRRGGEPAAFGAIPAYAASDDSGSFSLFALTPGEGMVEVAAEGFETQRRRVQVASGLQREDFVLGARRAFSISGRVLGPPTRTAGGVVAAASEMGEQAATSEVAPDGTFNVEDLEPGLYRLDLTADQLVSAHPDVAVAVVDQDVLGIVLEAIEPCRLTASFAGVPAGEEVRLRVHDNTGSDEAEALLQPGTDRLTLSRLRPGPLLIEAEAVFTETKQLQRIHCRGGEELKVTFDLSTKD